MKIPVNIFEFLKNEHFRKRPSMYLRGIRILDLVKFIDGYCTCEQFNKFNSGINEFLNKLTLEIHKDLSDSFPEHRNSNYHWYQMIEVLAEGKEENEIPIFFKHYDGFINSKDGKKWDISEK